MYRHSPVRNQRSKGIKIKHVLQICLLIAVCFWLIFQVKRSHDKKKELNARNSKISSSTQSNDDVIKFGRKDLLPKEETSKEIEKHEEEEEHEEEDKIEEEKDDEIDENELEKSDVYVDQDDDNTLDEDIERDESDENENEEKDSESQTENESSSEVHDQDGVVRNTHKAREENYRADDASSAVTHENSTLDNPIENIEMGSSEQENRVDNSTVNVKERDGKKTENKASPNTTTIQEKGSNNGPPSNTTVITSDLLQSPNVTEGVIVVDSQTLSKSTLKENRFNSSQGTSDSSETGNPQNVQRETIDSTDLEETEVRTDLDNGNREDIAVE